MTRYFITAWCDRPFFAQCEAETSTPEDALARARDAIHNAPARECDDGYLWDEWRVDTAEADAVLVHRDAPARLRAASDNLLLACRMVVERWEHGNLAEAARACRDAVAEATGENPECREPIVIEVRGGVVQEVRNVPPGVTYRIVDHDDREEREAPVAPAPSPLPPDPEGMNAARAVWAGRAVRTFQDATGSDDEDVLCDLLTDLLHWADCQRYDFEAAMLRARDHYEAETLGGDCKY